MAENKGVTGVIIHTPSLYHYRMRKQFPYRMVCSCARGTIMGDYSPTYRSYKSIYNLLQLVGDPPCTKAGSLPSLCSHDSYPSSLCFFPTGLRRWRVRPNSDVRSGHVRQAFRPESLGLTRGQNRDFKIF